MDVETKHYSDGTSATGTSPLPDLSPNQQEATLAPHEQRVVEEKRELDEKISKLAAFIASTQTFAGLDPRAQELLRQQGSQMIAYSDTLASRIAWFKVKTSDLSVNN